MITTKWSHQNSQVYNTMQSFKVRFFYTDRWFWSIFNPDSSINSNIFIRHFFDVLWNTSKVVIKWYCLFPLSQILGVDQQVWSCLAHCTDATGGISMLFQMSQRKVARFPIISIFFCIWLPLKQEARGHVRDGSTVDGPVKFKSHLCLSRSPRILQNDWTAANRGSWWKCKYSRH